MSATQAPAPGTGAARDATSASPYPAAVQADLPSADPARALRVGLCAGEASGDLLGAGLVQQLRARFPGAEFAGIGGAAMRAAGVDTWHDASELAVMGLSEVLRHLPRLLSLRRRLRRRLLDWRPDVFIGIDAPDFNLGLERALKRRGVPTVHYVSPSVWAWREGRAAKIGRSADRVLCLFPMEPAIYARHGIDARFVGHPMADAMPLNPDRRRARAELGLDDGAPVLAVLPGSRLGEIARLGAIFLEAAAHVAARLPALRIVVPAATPECGDAIRALLSRSALPVDRVRLLDGQAREAMTAADVVLLASGTATLEAMLAKRPMVVGYRIAPSTYRIVKALGMLKVDRYALPNVLAGETIAPELMQDECTPTRLAEAVLAWFADPAAATALEPVYRDLHLALRRDASASAADAVAGLLGPAP
ncbi:lipid-A-disaccharide synthase [Luteimonas saliphila]|uniref:lipid-A-disaccharide synthase n=1 Tax=Luteimonas saliphila TaxID=2804919 RepID=UPI00192E224B|nr:lipid-A-disaccharide synthase [Luteimonas saliphila]